MITNLDYLRTAVEMLEQGGLTPGEELRILGGVEDIVSLNKERIESEISSRVDEIIKSIKEN